MNHSGVMSPLGWELSFAALLCAAPLVVATSAWWFGRFHRHGVRWSVVLTSFAALPGVAMVIEIALRVVERHVLRISIPPVFEFSTTLLSCSWWLVGPVLLLFGLVLRMGMTEVPTATNVVQAAHVALWLVSSWVALAFAASV